MNLVEWRKSQERENKQGGKKRKPLEKSTTANHEKDMIYSHAFVECSVNDRK